MLVGSKNNAVYVEVKNKRPNFLPLQSKPSFLLSTHANSSQTIPAGGGMGKGAQLGRRGETSCSPRALRESWWLLALGGGGGGGAAGQGATEGARGSYRNRGQGFVAAADKPLVTVKYALSKVVGEGGGVGGPLTSIKTIFFHLPFYS